MSLQLYTALRAWRRARSERKREAAPAPRPAPSGRPEEGAEAIVYAAGIACAGQIAERSRR